jgi:FkbM family methyltransferase
MPGNSTLHPAEKVSLQQGVMRAHFFEGAQTSTCAVATLSELLVAHQVERVNLLKIDVEGGELQVGKGLGFMV